MKGTISHPNFTRVSALPQVPQYESHTERLKAKRERRQQKHEDARPFVAWDGEGITRDDGEHVLTLLANSLGERLVAEDVWHPLTTNQCLRFMLGTSARHPGSIHVWFAFGYDINMILGDLPREELEKLYSSDGSEVYCESVSTSIEYRQGKSFAIRARVRKPGAGEYHTVSMLSYDTFTYFASSFVKACDKYLGTDWPGRGLVIEGKQERATGFSHVDVIRYNDAELQALVLLMSELRARLSHVGIFPKHWHGPGAIASTILASRDVKSHRMALPDILEIPVRYAYSGGRFELLRYGSVRGPSWRYDRRSAYPYAATLLGSAVGQWSYNKSPSMPIDPRSLYHCEWHSTNTEYPQPFHYRSTDNRISYPYHLTGWYWGYEVIQAMRLPYGTCTILESFTLDPVEDCKPFAFMQELYDMRRALIRQGHGAELALKLSLNSIYGKLIQQLGWHISAKGELDVPTYFNLFAASQITSITRAALFEVMIDNAGYDDVISFETDAIFTSRRWDRITIGEGLGEWEEKQLDDLTYIQSGVYAATNGASHARGLTRLVWPTNPVETFRDMIEHRWDPYQYELTTFVGMGLALSQDMGKWRRWVTTSRKLQTLEPTLGMSKRNHDITKCSCQDDDSMQLDIWHSTRVFDKVVTPGSRAYDLAWRPVTTVWDTDAVSSFQ